MQIGQKLISFFFLLPLVFLLCLIIYRSKHPSQTAAFNYLRTAVSFSSAQVEKTSSDWNSYTNRTEDIVDASDELKLKTKLHELLQGRNLNEQQLQEAENSGADLLESLKNGNYNQFSRARIPSRVFEVSKYWVQELQRSSGISASAAPLDHYQKIWEKTFKTNSLWTQVIFDRTNSILLNTNLNIIHQIVRFPKFYGSLGNVYLIRHDMPVFNYDSLQQKELERNKGIVVWSLFFMATDPKSSQTTPFMISFFWDSQVNKWIPISFLRGFVEDPKVNIEFF